MTTNETIMNAISVILMFKKKVVACNNFSAMKLLTWFMDRIHDDVVMSDKMSVVTFKCLVGCVAMTIKERDENREREISVSGINISIALVCIESIGWMRQ